MKKDWRPLRAIACAAATVGLLSQPALGQQGSGVVEFQGKSFPALAALGPPPIPPDNRQSVDDRGFPLSDDPKVELGKMLFFDARLSGDVSIACSDCHKPTAGWTDGEDVCRGYPGAVHWRNCQPVLNSAYYSKLFWAGSSKSLENQARTAARGAVSGNGEDDMMEERLRQVPDYVRRFKAVFGTEWPLLKDAWRAISAFERSVIQVDTPFDRYMEGDEQALSESARRGLALFKDKGCVQCHNGAFLTDEKYYNLGVPDNPVFEESALRQITFRFEQFAKGVPEHVYRTTKTDLGLFFRMKREEDMGKFRTPSLRYLVYTPPYMHNGVFFTLEEVIDFYDEGGGDDLIEETFGHRTKTELVKPLNLTDGEKEDFLAFLESLSGAEVIIEAPRLPQYAVME